MSKAEDIALVSQVIFFGSERAFRRLVDKYQASVRLFFLSHTGGDKMLSDDLAQETFIKAWTHIASFKGLSAFPTWLYSIAYRVLSDYFRTRKETESLDPVRTDQLYQEEQPDLADDYDLYQALRQLKPDERTCILLFYREDQTIAKITAITGIPQGTVKSHLSRAKTKMANFLNNQGYAYKKGSRIGAKVKEALLCCLF